MWKMTLLAICLIFSACAGQRPSMCKVPTPNSYAGRPDLLKERQVLLDLLKLRVKTMRECVKALALAENEKDSKRATLLKYSAFNFCADRFSDYAAAADRAKENAHGDYLEAVILLKQTAKLYVDVAHLLAICAKLAGEEAEKCERLPGIIMVGIRVITIQTKELLQKIVGNELEDVFPLRLNWEMR